MATSPTYHCTKCGYSGDSDYHDPYRCQVLEQLVDTAERAEWTNTLLESILTFLREKFTLEMMRRNL